jgi:hypothetical protein
MTIEIVNINNRDTTVIRADEGKVFRRKHDGFIMGTEIFLGNDYSLGYERKDLPEYYEEIEVPEEYLKGLEPILPE